MTTVNLAANILVGVIAAIHVYILVLEMFLWNTPRGRKVFATDADFAAKAAPLAANQGLYNGFLAAGLVWALITDGTTTYQAKVFFLSCVIVAGLYGTFTVSKRILYIQTVPAAIALALVVAA
jgi:putative membrane protein